MTKRSPGGSRAAGENYITRPSRQSGSNPTGVVLLFRAGSIARHKRSLREGSGGLSATSSLQRCAWIPAARREPQMADHDNWLLGLVV